MPFDDFTACPVDVGTLLAVLCLPSVAVAAGDWLLGASPPAVAAGDWLFFAPPCRGVSLLLELSAVDATDEKSSEKLASEPESNNIID